MPASLQPFISLRIVAVKRQQNCPCTQSSVRASGALNIQKAWIYKSGSVYESGGWHVGTSGSYQAIKWLGENDGTTTQLLSWQKYEIINCCENNSLPKSGPNLNSFLRGLRGDDWGTWRWGVMSVRVWRHCGMSLSNQLPKAGGKLQAWTSLALLKSWHRAGTGGHWVSTSMASQPVTSYAPT